jgi:hypothetical protein
MKRETNPELEADASSKQARPNLSFNVKGEAMWI